MSEENSGSRVDDDRTPTRTRSRTTTRRLFVQSVGIAGFGLTTGATLATSTEDGERENSAVSTPSAAEPTAIDSPTVIDEPGEYELVADLAPDALEQVACIVIDSEDVTFRGNGHTIDGSGVGRCISIDRWHTGYEELWEPVIEDVVVRGGDVGIYGRLAGMYGRYTNVTAVENGTGFEFTVDGGTLTNCVVEGNDVGIALQGHDQWGGSHLDLNGSTIESNERMGLWVGYESFADVSETRLVENGTGVRTMSHAGATRLERCHLCRNQHYGVEAGSAPGWHEFDEGEPPREGRVTAIDNYWGEANGPSSFGDPEEPFTDPETGRPADGDGDAISESLESGVSAVRFDPFRESTIDDIGADR